MFIVYPSNIDILIDSVRLHIGDTDKKKFSDSLVRFSLVNSIKFLHKKWKNRYMIYRTDMPMEAPSGVVVPSGYIYAKLPEGEAFIPAGLVENDVFRNPYYKFLDPISSVVSQEDEYPITLAAAIILGRSYLNSSVETFQSWSDGEYSFSNISSQRTLQSLVESDLTALDSFFGKKLHMGLRSDFPDNFSISYSDLYYGIPIIW